MQGVCFGLEEKCMFMPYTNTIKKSIPTTNRMNPVDLEEKKKVKNQQEKFEVMGKGF